MPSASKTLLPEPPRRVTHSEIAAHLGVSRSAVTEALHGSRKSNIRPELRNRILEAAREMNYRPRNITTHNIAYVPSLEELVLEASSAFLVKINEALRAQNYRMTLAGLEAKDPQSLAQTLNPKTVDGAIFTRWLDGKIAELLPPEIPWVLTTAEDGITPDVDNVTIDVVQSLATITNHLMEYGHQRLCLVTGPQRLGFHRRMIEGMRQAMKAAKLPASQVHVLEVEFDEEIAPALQATMKGKDKPTAVVAGSPEKAITVLYHLRGLGLRVPQDVSVVSAYDSHHFRAYDPFLTAARAESEIADKVVERLLEKIADPASPPRQVLVPGQLIERESVCRPKPR